MQGVWTPAQPWESVVSGRMRMFPRVQEVPTTQGEEEVTVEEFAAACKARLTTMYEERTKSKHADPFKAFNACTPALRIELNQAALEFAKSWNPPQES